MRRLLAALAVAVGLTVLNVSAATAGHPRARLVPWNATPGEWNDVLLESAEAIPASRTLRSRVVTT